jgi:hypothetical protein
VRRECLIVVIIAVVVDMVIVIIGLEMFLCFILVSIGGRGLVAAETVTRRRWDDSR